MTVSAPIPARVIGPIGGQSLTAKSLTEATRPPVPQANCSPHTLSEFARILRGTQEVLEANFADVREMGAEIGAPSSRSKRQTPVRPGAHAVPVPADREIGARAPGSGPWGWKMRPRKS